MTTDNTPTPPLALVERARELAGHIKKLEGVGCSNCDGSGKEAVHVLEEPHTAPSCSWCGGSGASALERRIPELLAANAALCDAVESLQKELKLASKYGGFARAEKAEAERDALRARVQELDDDTDALNSCLSFAQGQITNLRAQVEAQREELDAAFVHQGKLTADLATARAEVERLQWRMKGTQHGPQCDEQAAEIARLTAEVERLTDDAEDRSTQSLIEASIRISKQDEEITRLTDGLQAYRTAHACHDPEGWGPVNGCASCEWERADAERGASPPPRREAFSNGILIESDVGAGEGEVQ